MKTINETIKKVYGHYPEKVLQFGEGNFLRAFTDWMVNNANANQDYHGSIVLCQPIAQGLADMINDQDGMYTLVMRGLEEGQVVEKVEQITSVSRCINPYSDYQALLDIARSEALEVVISNTTEAGISYSSGILATDAPPASFPAKVTVLLYERFKAFQGASDKGLLFIPVELIDKNGERLKHIVIQYAREWGLGDDFISWVERSNKFANTLVDRIVTGYPHDQVGYFEEKLGYKDNLIVTSEVFNLWVIEGRKEWADIFPIHKNVANVLWTEDATPYKTRKVRILNGAHTATVLAAFLAGHNFVLDFMNDPVFKTFLDKVIYEEIIPTLDLPKEELVDFADAVSGRFSNPYIKHKLLDISLNSCAKFAERCLPSLLVYADRMDKLPDALTFSFAAFMKFYDGRMSGQEFLGTRSLKDTYPIRDNAEVMEFFEKAWALGNIDATVEAVLSHKEFWKNRDLTEIPGLAGRISDYLRQMEASDIQTVLASIVS